MRIKEGELKVYEGDIVSKFKLLNFMLNPTMRKNLIEKFKLLVYSKVVFKKGCLKKIKQPHVMNITLRLLVIYYCSPL
jgi:hypothetical protein